MELKGPQTNDLSILKLLEKSILVLSPINYYMNDRRSTN